MEPFVITIARGFGSGGKEAGVRIAERLNIPCYENQILKMASEYSGLNESLFEMADERLKRSVLLKKLTQSPFLKIAEPTDRKFESDDNLFQIQSLIIRELAKTTSCVIIGKCADYVLKDYSNVASFYIEAPREACVDSIMDKLKVTEEEAHKLIQRTDRFRADYYKYYTGGKDWTDPINYDMVLNSARIGRDKCVDVIGNYLKIKFEGRKL